MNYKHRAVTNVNNKSAELMPEVRLVVAILKRAIDDYFAADLNAAVFVWSADFNYWCDSIGLNPDYLRRRYLS